MKMISVHSPKLQTNATLRTLCLASLGSALEFYDFIILVFFTGMIGNLFFPVSLPDWLRPREIWRVTTLNLSLLAQRPSRTRWPVL